MTASRAQLIPLPRDVKVREFALTHSPVIVGRGDECDVSVRHDRKTSRRHAEFLKEEGTWYVRDLGSANGTLLNGSKVARSPLRDGDNVRIGDTNILFVCPATLPAPRLRWVPAEQNVDTRDATVIKHGRLTIGRAKDNDLRLPEAESVSRNHAVIVFEDGVWRVHDLNSRNGTYVNNRRVQRQQLRDGDEIRFGQERYRFSTSTEPSAVMEETDMELPEEEEVTVRFISVGGIKTIGNVISGSYRVGFLGVNLPGRKEVLLTAGAFLLGFFAGCAWHLLVAGRAATAPEGVRWSGALIPGFLGGFAGAILTALPDMTKRVTLDPYFRLRARLLHSAAARHMRRVEKRLSNTLRANPKDPTAMADMIGLRVLQNNLHGANELVSSYSDTTKATPQLLNNMGVTLLRSHFPTRAMESLSVALRADPGKALCHANMGRARLHAHMADAAVEALEEAIALSPNDVGFQVSLGVALLRAGRLREAQGMFRAALDNLPNSSDAANDAGVVHHLQRNLESSIRMLRTALRHSPGHVCAHANLGMEYLFRGEFLRAIQELTKARHLSPESPRIRNNLSIAYYVSQAPGTAERELMSAEESSTIPEEVLYNLGTLYHLMGRYTEAAEFLTRAVQRNPRDAASRVNLGCALFQTGNLQRAAQMFESALEYDRRNPAALTNFGLSLILLGRVKEAIPYIEWAAEVQPDQLAVQFNLAYAHQLAGNAEESVRAFEHLLHTSDDVLAEINANLGLCYYFLGGNLALATRSLETALALSPHLHTVHLSLGRIYCEREELGQAQIHLEMAIKDEPQNPDVYRNLGLVYYQTGQIDRAIQTFLRAAQLSPHNAGDHNNLALAYAKKGKHEEAIYHFKRALEYEPGDVSTLSNLGLSYYLSGRVDLALVQWHEVSRLSPKYAAEREAVRYAEFDEVCLGYTPLDWQARAVYIPPVCMGLRYHVLLSDENEFGEVDLTDPDLAPVPSLLRRARRYEEALRALYA